MNGEEEGILEVMQELHPPSLIEDQSPAETTRDPEQVEECQSLNALNEPEAERELAPDENVEGREGDCEVGDSSLPGERNCEVFGAAEISAVKDELVLETEGKGEDEVLPAAAVEGDGLIGGIEDLTVAEKDGGVRDEKTFPAGDEGGELMGEGVAMEDEEQGVGEESVEVKGASPEGDTDNEQNVQADDEIEKLKDEQKAPEVQLSCSSCKEEGKLDGDGESQRDIEQDCESKFGEVTAQVDENREMEEAGAHTDDYLLPRALSDGDMIKEGNTEALDAEIKELEDSKIDLEEVKRELKEEEEEKQMEVGEDMGIKEEDEEMEGGEAKEVDKETEEEEEIEVKASKEKEIEGGERHADSKKDEVMPVAEKEPEKGEETELEVEANKKKAMEDEERQVDAQENEEMQRGEDKEVGKETEEDEETEVEKEMEDKADAKEVEGMLVEGEKEVEKETDEEEPNKGKILEDEKRHVDAHEDEDVEMQGGEAKEVQKVTEIEANKENEMEDEDVEMQGGEAKEVEKVIEIEANKENEMEDEERQAITKEDEEMEGEEERKVEGEAEEETEDEEEREVDADEEKEMEDNEREQSPKSGSGKRKRGRNSEAVGKASSKKKLREDVCFICLDGGDLVFCDRRGCHKGYHPSCAELDEAFFQSKGRWNCGWHLCNQCKKAACFMCYTCQFALCKGCAKSDAIFICVRGNKGLCETCMRNVMLIESNEGNAGTDESTVDDKSRKNYLFKDYWAEQKEMLSLTLDEIAQAKSRWMHEMPTEILAGNVNGGIVTDTYLGSAETTDSKRTKPKKRMRSSTKDVEYDADYSSGKAEASGAKKKGKKGLKSLSKEDFDSDNSSKDNVGSFTRGRKAKKLSKAHAFEVDSASHGGLISGDISSQSGTEWASKELLEFVVHMKDGNRAPLSQYDVQELLLEYIQRNKLRDPRRKSQIVCDAMLQKLFGKPRVGHFEMLKLLELHFLIREDSQADDNQGSVVDAEGSQFDADENADSLVDLGKYRGKKARRKGDGRLQSNLDDYAAIDMHNITLIYLRRNLIEALLEDSEGFHEKVVGSFVRIRIPGSNQKQDIYRLVQVIGTNKAEPYKVGKRIAYCMLEILNLNKTEVVSIDTISNQDFTEDECKRLRQSIKCGLISRLTVGDVMDKAKDLQAVRVTDWLETEITRLNHLRDRASDLGRKKELRECVEKLQLLSTPEERQRRLDEIPEVHADPNMDPSHESEDESEPEEKGQEINVRPRETSFQWRERDHFPSRKGESASTDPWSPTERMATRKWDSSRSLSGKGFSSRLEDTSAPEEAFHGSPWSPVRDKLASHSTSSETFRTTPDSSRGKMGQYPEMRNDSSASAPSDASQPFSASLVQNPVKFSDSEKLWHYKDPTGKDQGPFSVVQLRKWNKSGYFPATLHIWRTGQSEDDAIFLTEALAGRFEKLPSQMLRKPIDSPSNQTYRGHMLKVDRNRGVGSSTRDTFDQMSPVMQRSRSDTSSKGWAPHSVDTSKFSHNDSPNLSSTPPSQRTSSGWSGRSKVSRWSGSPTPIHLPSSASSSPAANGMLPSPTPESSRVLGSSNSPLYEHNRGFNRSHLAQQSTRDSINVPSRSREDERYAQQPPPQSIVPHQTQQPVTETTTANNTIQPVSGQNLAVSSHGWGTGGYMPNPETTSNLNTNNGVQLQGQQTVYGQWTNTPANNLPPPPPQPTYGNSGTFPVQNPSAALPSQAPWTPQVAATQPNMQWTGMPTTQYPGNPGATWAPPVQQANPTNIGWGPPAGQYGSQPGPVAPANVIQTTGQTPGMQQGNMNMTWQPAGNMNPGGWAPLPANPGGPGPWNWQQQQQPPPHGGAGMGPPGRPMRRKSDMPCPFFMQGHCKKGANCDYRHN